MKHILPCILTNLKRNGKETFKFKIKAKKVNSMHMENKQTSNKHILKNNVKYEIASIQLQTNIFNEINVIQLT